MKRLLFAVLLFLIPSLAQAASCSSYPFTLQNNTTADATQVMSNFNTVRNCVINNAAGSGVNTDITSLTGLSTPLSVPQGGTPVFIGGTSTGTANAQVVASTNPIGYSLTSGYRVTFTAGATNTGATTLNVNSTGITSVRKLGHSGLEALTGGEIVSGNIVEALYDGTYFVLLTTPFADISTLTTIASATTTDLGSISSHNAQITGTVTITSFGSTASVTEPIYYISFTGALTLTYNATSLIIPGQGNITTANGDTATVEYLGSGNWRVLQYTKASGAGIVAITPLCGASQFTANNNSGTPNTSYDMAAGTATLVNTSGVTITASSVSVTVNATTTGANGLDAGSLANATWYYGWLISNGNTVAGLLSTSSTTPTMPSGYTYKCRLSEIITDGSAHFLVVKTVGRNSQYIVSASTVPPNIINGASGSGTTDSPTMTAVSIANFAPPTAVMIRLMIENRYHGSGPNEVFAAPSTAWGGTNRGPIGTAGFPYPLWVNAGNNGGMMAEFVLEGTTVGYWGGGAGAALSALGWTSNVNAN